MADMGIGDEFGALAARSELDGFHEDGPSLEELAIDDSLSDLEKLQRYLSADFVLHRLFTLKEMCEVSQRVGFQTTVTHILPMLERLVTDTEPVIRQTVLQLVPQLGASLIAQGGDAGYDQMVRVLVPLTATMLSDGTQSVRADAAVALVEVAKLVRTEQLGSVIVPHVTKLAKDSIDEEARAEACKLMNELSAVLPVALSVGVLMPLLTEVGADPMFRVRKAAAGSMAILGGVLGAAGKLQPLLELFTTLARDEIWGVRKACAETLPALAAHVDEATLTGVLLPLFLAFVDDVSRWVRGAAYQSLGPLIACFRAEVPESLVALFCGMTAPTLAKTIDSEITTHCAFSFPAVIQALGADAWPRVKPTYELLVRDLQWRVRRTLAFSLHVVARILGPDLAETALGSAFDTLLRDLDEVRVGVLQSYAAFVAVVAPASRLRYLTLLAEIRDGADNWRFREVIAEQLAPLAQLVSPDQVSSFIVPMLLHLCEDSVASVRATANKAVGPILHGVLEAGAPERALPLVNHIRDMASGRSFQTRQMFIRCMHCVLDHVDDTVFAQQFLASLLKLKDDRVPNVRLLLSKLLLALQQRPSLSTKPEVAAALAQLRADPDSDVAFFASTADV